MRRFITNHANLPIPLVMRIRDMEPHKINKRRVRIIFLKYDPTFFV